MTTESKRTQQRRLSSENHLHKEEKRYISVGKLGFDEEFCDFLRGKNLYFRFGRRTKERLEIDVQFISNPKNYPINIDSDPDPDPNLE